MNKIFKLSILLPLTVIMFSFYGCSDDDDSAADCTALTNDYSTAAESFAEAFAALFAAGLTGEGDVDELNAAFSTACTEQSNAAVSWVDGGCGGASDLGLSDAGLASLRDGSFCAELTGGGLQILNQSLNDN